MLPKKKRDSDLKVNSNGFALFVIGLTLAGFLGGALRLFLNSERAQQRILSEVQRKFPEWNVEAESVELHLASGVWPGVTINLPRAHVHRNGQCGKPSFSVDVQSLRIPVSLWSILTSQDRLGTVAIEQVDIELQESPCPGEARKAPPQTTTSSTVSALGSRIDIKNLGLRSAYEEIKDRVDGLTLGQVLVRNPTAPDWSFRARDLHLDAGSTVEVNGTFSVWRQFKNGELRQEFRLRSTLQGPLLHWELRTSIKEGEFRWSGQLDEEGRTFLQRVQLRQGPLSDLLDMLYKAGVPVSSSGIKRVWLNCEVVQGGSFQAFSSVREIPLRVGVCGLDGELGRINIEPQVFYLNEPHLRNGSLALRVSKLSVDSLMGILGQSKVPVTFSTLGLWTGKIEAESLSQMNWEGELEGVKLNVSNKSLRGVETLTSLHTEGRLSDSRLELGLSEFQILGGSRGGQVDIGYDLKAEQGEFNVQFDQLTPSASIQNLLVQGTMEPLRLQAKGEIIGGRLMDLSGQFSTSRVGGVGWSLYPVHGRISQVRPEQFHLEVLAENFEWNENFRYSAFASSVLNTFDMKVTDNALKDIEVNLDIQAQVGRVTSATAKLKEQVIEFQGEWQRGRALVGQVRIGQRKQGQWLPVEVNHLTGQILN